MAYYRLLQQLLLNYFPKMQQQQYLIIEIESGEVI